MVAVYRVPGKSGRTEGVKVAVTPPAGYVTVPGTEVNVKPVCKVNVPGGVIVVESITSLKVAVTGLLTDTPTIPLGVGTVEITEGATVGGRPPVSGPGLVTILDINVTPVGPKA